MAVIIEIRRKGGQLVNRIRCASDEISIGRGFDNSVIVDDVFVSAHHLRLIRVANGWRVQDLHSLNGYQIRPKGKANTLISDVLQQGDQLLLGQLVLAVYDSSYAVGPALRAHASERQLTNFGRWQVWPLLVLATLGLVLLMGYLSAVDEVRPKAVFAVLIRELTILLSLSAAWGLAGKIFRHQPKFFSHLGLWSLYVLFSILSDWCATAVAYNLGSDAIGLVLALVVQFVLLSAVLWGSLSLATNLRLKGRMGAALATSFVFLFLQFFQSMQLQPSFSPIPSYQSGMKPPLLLAATPIEKQSLLDIRDRVFDESEELADVDYD